MIQTKLKKEREKEVSSDARRAEAADGFERAQRVHLPTRGQII